MDSVYFASLQPPAVYRIDSFDMLDELYEAVPEAPSWNRRTDLERPEIEATSVSITELDAGVIIGAWGQRLDQAGPAPEHESAPAAPPVEPDHARVLAPTIAGASTVDITEDSAPPAPSLVDLQNEAPVAPETAEATSGADSFLDFDAPGEPPPIRFERSVWEPPTETQIQAEEAQIQLSRREALSAFRDIAADTDPKGTGLTWG